MVKEQQYQLVTDFVNYEVVQKSDSLGMVNSFNPFSAVKQIELFEWMRQDRLTSFGCADCPLTFLY